MIPIWLDVSGKYLLVVGLGAVGQRRALLFQRAGAIVIGTLASWPFYNKIINNLAKPICDITAGKSHPAMHLSGCGSLYVNGILGPLNLQITVSLIIGIIATSPFWLYQMWSFISPGLHKKERRFSRIFITVATPFFFGGAYLGYRVVPVGVKVLLGFTPASLNNLIRFDDYLNFVLRLILVFGIAFELPVFLVGLNFAGVLTGKAILKPWRFAIFAIALFTAMFTPTGDPFTMSLLALPLIFFYFLAGFIGILNDKRKTI